MMKVNVHNYFKKEIPFQIKWKYINKHKSDVTNIFLLKLLECTKAVFDRDFLKFHAVGILRKQRSKLGQKKNFFFFFMNSCTSRFVVFCIFFHWNAVNQYICLYFSQIATQWSSKKSFLKFLFSFSKHCGEKYEQTNWPYISFKNSILA